jgi:purine nucleoside permease
MKSSLYNRLQQNIVTKSLTNALIIEQMNSKTNIYILENTLIEEMIELTNALNIKTMKKKEI